MRKQVIVLLGAGILFTQQALASEQCNLKPDAYIHCPTCQTLDDFAFYGASALYSAGQQRSIQVTGDNGSDVYVSMGTAWNSASLGIDAGHFGRWGVDIPYPSLTYAQVYARDINNKVNGSLPHNGRYLYGALKAKCRQIEEEQEKNGESSNSPSGAEKNDHYFSNALGNGSRWVWTQPIAWSYAGLRETNIITESCGFSCSKQNTSGPGTIITTQSL